LRYATCTEIDFENIVAEWFATQRSKRAKAKENEENIDDRNLISN